MCVAAIENSPDLKIKVGSQPILNGQNYIVKFFTLFFWLKRELYTLLQLE